MNLPSQVIMITSSVKKRESSSQCVSTPIKVPLNFGCKIEVPKDKEKYIGRGEKKRNTTKFETYYLAILTMPEPCRFVSVRHGW